MGEICQSNISTKNSNEPALFVYSNNKTNYESEVLLNCVVLNVNKIGKNEKVTSPKLYVQSLPFFIVISRETEVLGIQMVVSEEIQSQWSCKFSVRFWAEERADQPVTFDEKYEYQLSNTDSSISHTIDSESNLPVTKLQFNIDISAQFPNGGYEWPSRAATGYTGLVNEGATCYINSMLQSLFCTNEFRRIIFNIGIEPEDANNSFIFWLKYIFYTMQFGGVPKIGTIEMIRCFDWEEMTATNQQDTQEFLRRLIDKLLQFVEGTESKDSIVNLFAGTIRKTTRCKNVVYVTTKTETFLDLQLPIKDDSNIYGAFGTYLHTLSISNYEYGNEGEKDDAEQEYQFISLPPVLHVQLSRFNYNAKTHKLTKNNKRFEFYPKLDLRQYCADATYTLHSILVHSGTTSSGHYMAFICPKADDHWYKFNDQIVTKCSTEEAIEYNYGNGCGSANAYMLVYIKDECIEQILCDVRMENEVEKNLIEAEIAKEIQRISMQDRYIEVVVFTPEKLQQTEYYASGKSLFDPNRGQVFTIDKYKQLSDLLLLLVAAFNVGQSGVIALWLVNDKKDTVRFCGTEAQSDTMLKNVFKKDRVYLFYELLPMEEAFSCSFNKAEDAFIFIKWYDPSKHSLVYFGHRYFRLQQTVQNVRQFIRDEIGYGDDEHNIAIIVEYGSSNDYSHRLVGKKEKISKITSKNGDTSSAIVVFEIVAESCKPKFLSIFAAHSSGQKPIAPIAIENGIELTIKNINEGYELFSKVFEPQTTIHGIVQVISEMNNRAIDDIELLDAVNNVVAKDFFTLTLEEYSSQRNTRTRSQAKKGLTFSYKINQTFGQPIEEMEGQVTLAEDISSTHCEPMDCQYENNFDSISMELCHTEDVQKSVEEVPSVQMPDVEMPNAEGLIRPCVGNIPVIFHNRQTPTRITCEHYRDEKMQDILSSFADIYGFYLNKLEFTDEKGGLLDRTHRPLELFLATDQDCMNIYYEEIVVTESTRSTDDLKQVLRLKFKDVLNKRTDLDLTFRDDDNLSKAINQIIDVMDLDRSSTHFFTSKGKKIGKTLLNSKMSKFRKSNSLNIEYETEDDRHLELQRVSRKGLEVCKFFYPISNSTTIEEICEKSAASSSRILKMKDGAIFGIVAPEVKAIDLLTDEFEYRLDECGKIWDAKKDPFFICVRFVKNCPKERLNIPLLVEADHGDSLWGFGLRVIQQMGATDMNILNDLEFEGDCIVHDPNGSATPAQSSLIVKPKDPQTIPVILLNMNCKDKNRKKFRSSYAYDL